MAMHTGAVAPGNGKYNYNQKEDAMSLFFSRRGIRLILMLLICGKNITI
jgi:hypothetical protein